MSCVLIRSLLRIHTYCSTFVTLIKINSSPYEDGWMIKIKPSSPSELDSLLGPKEYTKFCEEEDAAHWSLYLLLQLYGTDMYFICLWSCYLLNNFFFKYNGTASASSHFSFPAIVTDTSVCLPPRVIKKQFSLSLLCIIIFTCGALSIFTGLVGGRSWKLTLCFQLHEVADKNQNLKCGQIKSIFWENIAHKYHVWSKLKMFKSFYNLSMPLSCSMLLNSFMSKTWPFILASQQWYLLFNLSPKFSNPFGGMGLGWYQISHMWCLFF